MQEDLGLAAGGEVVEAQLLPIGDLERMLLDLNSSSILPPAVGETVRERALLVRGGGTGGGCGLLIVGTTGALWRKEGKEEGRLTLERGHCNLPSLSRGLHKPRIRLEGFSFGRAGREGRLRSLSSMKVFTCSRAL